MGIKIDQNCYFSAMKREDFAINEQSIEQQAKSALHFQYGRVSYKSFSIEYAALEENEERCERKIKAIPTILWKICELVYHVAITIFIAIPKLLFREVDYFQAHIFYLIRDGQELYGRVMSLFHDQYGLYYIQGSQFQKACYDCFLEEYTKAKVTLPAIQQRQNQRVPLQQNTLRSDPIPDNKLVHTINKEENFDLVLKQIKQSTPDTKEQERLLIELAEKLLASGDLDKAFKVIKEVYSDKKTKEKFLVKLARAHFTNRNLDEAFKVIKGISSDKEAKENCLVELAEAHFTNRNLDEAFKVIKEVSSNKEAKNKFLIKLIEQYLANDDLDKAFKAIKEISSNIQIKEAFFAQLAENHLAKGNLDKVFEITQEIDSDTKVKDGLLIQLLEAYHHSNQEDKALGVITKIIINLLFDEAMQIDGVVEDLDCWTKMQKHMDGFATQLAQHCYVQIKVKVYEEKKESAITVIQDEVSQKKGQFLQLVK